MMPVSLIAQIDVDSVLARIERNNTTLAAMRKNVDAEKIGNTMGIYLQNPEFGFNFLWSDPTSVGNRTDISIKQSFDFPTAYGHRRQISEFRNMQAELDYQKQRKNILLEARLLCADIIYANALAEEYRVRLGNARELAAAYEAMFEKGEVGVLEYNKAQLNLLNVKKEAGVVEIEKAAYLKQLTALNAGQPVEINSSVLLLPQLPPGFDQWYTEAEQDNPSLQWLDREIQLNMEQEKLNRSLWLPKASAGYMSENRYGEHFQGITAGVSIPLWENKNTVRYAEARTLALNSVVTDYKLQLYNQLKIQFEKAISLKNMVDEYRQSLNLYSNAELLKKALDEGELSLLNYLMEISLTYTTIDTYIKGQNELNKSLILLYQYQY